MKPLKICRIPAAIVLIGLALVSVAIVSAAATETHPAHVRDISDRAYEPAVIDLLDNAKESIVISMYIIKPSEKGPVGLLMKDLKEALARGVSVEIYLNTRFRSKKASQAPEKKLRLLREKGAVIRGVDSNYRLHDKLIIVDSRYVVEGSPNWSVSALKSNFESATLIDSPLLARAKLGRLKELPLESDKPERKRRREDLRRAGALPEGAVILLSKALLEERGLFPEMVIRHDERSMDTYLLILAEEKRWPPLREGTPGRERAFPLSLEDTARALKIPSSWTTTAKRRQVIKTLRKLKNKYRLIDVEFQYGEDAWIILKDLAGDTFPVEGSFFEADSLASKSHDAKFVLLMKALLEEEGKSIDSYTREELSERFHVGLNPIRKGIRQIE